MQNSNFGGMENVGNTTITNNRIMPYPEATDGAFEYIISVKCHEFYHNINGSEVTGWSPFELWLNEAVTVLIEQEHHAFLFGEEYGRLQTILWLYNPSGGTFRDDEGAIAMPIEPDGFNSPDELISNVTYVKAPEFVRMVQSLMGKENFAKALSNYYKKFKHSNAKREQWLQCMEEASGMKFGEMAEGWLKRTGFPTVKAASAYENGTLTLELSQGEKTWQFPIRIALIDSEGKEIAESERLESKISNRYKRKKQRVSKKNYQRIIYKNAIFL